MLDLSEVEFSSWDKRNCITLPKTLTPELAEETGLHIGDGCLIAPGSMYMYSLRGHSIDDAEFYKFFIPRLYRGVYNLSPRIRVWPDVIGFQTFSRAIGTFKSRVLDLPIGRKGDISIPSILFEKDMFRHLLRGIFDTDGCIDFEKKSRDKPYYPRITISTTSKVLSNQLTEILSDVLGFNLSVWHTDYNNFRWRRIHRICTRGSENFNRWFGEIGSRNPKNLYKYSYWKSHGYAPVAQ